MYYSHTMKREEIYQLAELAKIAISDEEAERYANDFAQILSYIDLIQEVAVDTQDIQTLHHKNVLREDDDAYPAGSFHEVLLKEAPQTQDGFMKVHKVL